MKKIITTLLVGIFISSLCFSQDFLDLDNTSYPQKMIAKKRFFIDADPDGKLSSPRDTIYEKAVFVFKNRNKMTLYVDKNKIDYQIGEEVKRVENEKYSFITYNAIDYNGDKLEITFGTLLGEKAVHLNYGYTMINFK